MSQTPDPDEQLPEPANLRFLRLLVTVLTGVMIAGLLAILAMIVIQYRTTRAPLPEAITLPDGASATAYTQGSDWYAVVTADDEILIFDRASGEIRQRIAIAPGRNRPYFAAALRAQGAARTRVAPRAC